MAQHTPRYHVGDGVTMCHWSDRHAGTVTAVSPSGKTVTVQRDKATGHHHEMTDQQEWTYERDPHGITQTFTLRRDGRFWARGNAIGGLPVLGDGRHEFYDYSF